MPGTGIRCVSTEEARAAEYDNWDVVKYQPYLRITVEERPKPEEKTP